MPTKALNPWPARLRTIRKDRGLTQRAAAERLGVPLRTWINWENNQRNPSRANMRLIRMIFPNPEELA